MTQEYIKIFKIFGCNLKKIRESKKITLKELSQKTKIRINYLKKIEKGEAYGISIKKIFILAKVLKTPPHLFVK